MSSITRDHPRQLGNRMRIFTTSAGFVEVFPLVPVDVTGGSWTRISTSTPGYRTMTDKQLIDLPMNPFSYESTWRWSLSGYQKQRATNLVTGTWPTDDTVGLYPEEGTIITTPSKNLSILIDLKLRASRKILGKLKDQDFNLPVALLEGRKSIQMIGDSLTQLARAALSLRRGNFRGAAATLGLNPRTGNRKVSNHQSLASNWLELKLGWQPLVQDIYGATQYLEKFYGDNFLKRTKLTAKSERSTSVKSSSLDAIGTHVIRERGKYVVRYVLYFTELPEVKAGTALGLGNPAAVVWELVPFSFLVDYFFPLGAFLDNLDATFGRTFVKGCETVFYKGSSYGKVGNRPPTVNGNVKTEYQTQKEVMIEVVSCTRTPLTGFPPNHFPIYQNPLSTQHIATGLALVAQVFSGAPVKHLRI